MEIIDCPYCKSEEATRVRKNADIVRCVSCGLIYLRTRPAKRALYEIYQAYANDTSHMRPPSSIVEAKTHGLRREWFVKEAIGYCASKKGNWLDIGCGWGALLMNLREHGFTPMGIEMTRNCLDFAALQLQIPVSNSQFTDSAISKNFCEAISMVHVFEHIPNPKETLSKIHDTLVPGGIFCGIVPNIESYCSDVQKEDWVWLDPTHHYFHYSPTTLRQKLEDAGFEVLQLYTDIGDGCDFFMNVLKKEHPSKRKDEPDKIQRELELNGKGEEIRFYAKRL